MLKHRIITAAILIPLVVAVIFLLDAKWFSILFAVFVAIGACEWAALCKLNGKYRYFYSLFSVLILAGLYWLNNANVFSAIVLSGVVYWGFAIFLVVSYQKQRNLLPKSILALLVIGLLLLIPMWSSLTMLKAYSAGGSQLLMFLLLLIWSADSGAYFAGKRWGKRKLADRVSPGKTWEGIIAGVLAGIVITVAYVIVSNKELLHGLVFIGLAIVTVLISIIGDLMESLVKREANIKDSGSILPGHGGVLDRIDSLTAAGPVFVVGLLSMGVIA